MNKPIEKIELRVGGAYRIEGIIGEDGATAAALTAFLEYHEGQPVDVLINSPGGSAFEGAAIEAAIEAHGRVTVKIHGIAASAASLAAMGASRVLIHPAATMMIHDPSAATFGPADTHRQSADALDKLGGVYAAAYARRTGRSPAAMRQMMKAETWFTAEEAIRAGLADALETAERPEPVAAFDYARFRNAPAELVSLARAEGWATRSPAGSTGDQTMLDKPEAAGAAPASEATTRPETIAERTRAKRIREAVAAAKLSSSLADDLIERGVSVEDAVPQILAKWSEAGAVPNDSPMHGRPTIGMGRDWSAGSEFRAKAVAGLAARLDPKGEHSALARDGAQMSVADIAMHVCRMQGLKPFNQAEAIRMAAHSTSDFPLILENSLTNDVARRIDQALPAIARASHEVRREDYRAGRRLTLSATGMPQEVEEGGEIGFTTAEEKGELMPTLRDFAAGFNITNKALTNDANALGLLSQIAERMTQGAVERLRAVLLEPLLANSGAGQTMTDGKAVFHADHGNLASTGAALDVEALSLARLAMRRQKGLNGELYAVEPWGLLVPPELETTAQKVLAEIEAAKFSDVNPFTGSLELIVEPGLTAAAPWYVLGNPGRYDGLAHAFLDGQSAPRVESRPGWSTLGLEMRLVWALDAKFVEWATWYRNPGE